MKLRRSTIGRYVNRETEQNLLNVITSYLAYVHDSVYSNRLNVFVRKNRYLGAIYVEHFQTEHPTRVLCRSLFNKKKWRRKVTPETNMAIRHLRSAELYMLSAGTHISILPMVEFLLAGSQSLSLY